MKSDGSVQYTIRGIPEAVDHALRRKAQQRQISLNQLLVEELANATGMRAGKKFRSLDLLAGKWKDSAEFRRVLAEQRQIDEDLWK